MIYIALLRGINVGGKAMVSMAELKSCFESLGFSKVKTYINSGNVLFQSTETNRGALTEQIENSLKSAFQLDIKVLLKTDNELKALVTEIPENWVNDTTSRCDVLFLWPAIDVSDTLEKIQFNPEVEEVHYLPGAMLWHLPDRTLATKSRMTRLIGTPLYKQMTIRNVNTARKLITLADSL